MAKNPKKAQLNPIIARAREHFADQGTRIVRVPEWGAEDGDPLEIYVYPFTLKDQQRLMARHRGNMDDPEVLADAIILKACNSEGEKMFTVEDKRDLMNTVDGTVLVRVATEIMGVTSIEEAEKNF